MWRCCGEHHCVVLSTALRMTRIFSLPGAPGIHAAILSSQMSCRRRNLSQARDKQYTLGKLCLFTNNRQLRAKYYTDTATMEFQWVFIRFPELLYGVFAVIPKDQDYQTRTLLPINIPYQPSCTGEQSCGSMQPMKGSISSQVTSLKVSHSIPSICLVFLYS